MGKGFEFSRCSLDEQYAAQTERPALNEHTHKINQRVMMKGRFFWAWICLLEKSGCESGIFKGRLNKILDDVAGMAAGSHCTGETEILCLWLRFVISRESVGDWDIGSFGC